MKEINITLDNHIFPILAPKITTLIRGLSYDKLRDLTEIRLRTHQPLLLRLGTDDTMVSTAGYLTNDYQQAYICTSDDIARTFQLMSKNSIYALEQELKMGFITIAGGHRIGLAGQAIVNSGQLKAIKNIGSMNIRIAREVKGCANLILPYIIEGERHVLSTLIISPPRCGKTTVLRELIRYMSTRNHEKKYYGVQVGVVDERSEIAACQNGVPTVDLGERVDVLDACPKSEGMLMLIRSMAPQVIATDELGRTEDADAIREALNAGINIIATVHGRDVNEVSERPYIGDLITGRFFDRYVVLTDRPQVGTVKEVTDVKTGNVLYTQRKEDRSCG